MKMNILKQMKDRGLEIQRYETYYDETKPVKSVPDILDYCDLNLAFIKG